MVGRSEALKKHTERGAVLIEFVMLYPFFVFILLSLFGFSSFFLQCEHNLLHSTVKMHVFLHQKQKSEDLLSNSCFEHEQQSFVTQVFPKFSFLNHTLDTSQEVFVLADTHCKN